MKRSKSRSASKLSAYQKFVKKHMSKKNPPSMKQVAKLWHDSKK